MSNENDPDWCESCGVSHKDDPIIMGIPANIFTSGLSEDQKQGLERIIDCMDRAHMRMQDMIEGKDETLKVQYEALHRVLYGISDSAIIPIMHLITQGASPEQATKGVISAIGGMMFMAGWEFGKYESTPESQRRPLQPKREMTTTLTQTEEEQAKDLLERLMAEVQQERRNKQGSLNSEDDD
jgi:hypothetical protein